MKLRSKILAFTAAAASIVAIITVTLVLVSDDTLKNAGVNCDTISITAEYNGGAHTLAAQQSINYKNRTSEPLDEIRFHIYANAYKDGAENPPVNPSEVPQAYPNGKNFGGITVHSVTADNKTTETVIDGADDTVLAVPLETPLAPGAVTDIGINYTVTLANIKHRLGWTADTVNLANFYPVPCIYENNGWQTYPYSASGDPFYNDLHNFEVTLTAPASYVTASSGTLVKSSEKNGKRTLELKSTAIRDFAAVMSAKFKSLTKTVNETAVKYYYLDDSAPQKSLETSIKALETFSRLFTKYPYPQLSVVQTDFLHGGMEYGELVYISRDVLQPASAAARADHDRVIAHEIAHQWWYGIVGNNQSSTAWIDEGLAEYSTLLFYDQNPEYNVKRETVITNARANYSAFIKLVRGVGAELDTNMERELNAFNSSHEYVYMTYVRGLLLFCDLEYILTRDTLARALADFAQTVKFSIATPLKLIESIEKSTNTKVKVFFDTYINGNLI